MRQDRSPYPLSFLAIFDHFLIKKTHKDICNCDPVRQDQSPSPLSCHKVNIAAFCRTPDYWAATRSAGEGNNYLSISSSSSSSFPPSFLSSSSFLQAVTLPICHAIFANEKKLEENLQSLPLVCMSFLQSSKQPVDGNFLERSDFVMSRLECDNCPGLTQADADKSAKQQLLPPRQYKAIQWKSSRRNTMCGVTLSAIGWNTIMAAQAPFIIDCTVVGPAGPANCSFLWAAQFCQFLPNFLRQATPIPLLPAPPPSILFSPLVSLAVDPLWSKDEASHGDSSNWITLDNCPLMAGWDGTRSLLSTTLQIAATFLLLPFSWTSPTYCSCELC